MSIYSAVKLKLYCLGCMYSQNSLSLFKRYLSESYYDILKVPETCSSKDIREAFINLSKKNHPDKHINDPTMHDRFIKINEAYSILINPLTRRTYDINLQQKKKLGAPRSDSRNQYSSYANIYKSSSKTNNSNFTKEEPFTFYYKDGPNIKQCNPDNYYGVKGIPRIHSKYIAFILVIFAVGVVTIQLCGIRQNFLRSKQKALEKNRECNLIHSMAREKARLYGNDYQINILKQSLKSTFGEESDGSRANLENKSSIIDTSDLTQAADFSSAKEGDEIHVQNCEKCKKCKRM